jgi:hypothetical protein
MTFPFTMSAFSSVLMDFFLRALVFDVGAGRRWAAPYNADIATGMD